MKKSIAIIYIFYYQLIYILCDYDQSAVLNKLSAEDLNYLKENSFAIIPKKLDYILKNNNIQFLYIEDPTPFHYKYGPQIQSNIIIFRPKIYYKSLKEIIEDIKLNNDNNEENNSNNNSYNNLKVTLRIPWYSKNINFSFSSNNCRIYNYTDNRMWSLVD